MVSSDLSLQDSVSTPSTSVPPSGTTTDTKVESAINETVTPNVQTTTPEVQEASATINLKKETPTPKSSNNSKILIGILILVVLIVMGVLGYFLMTRTQSDSKSAESNLTVPTAVMESPTPVNEQAEVDSIDTTFPESDVMGIQTDLQAL